MPPTKLIKKSPKRRRRLTANAESLPTIGENNASIAPSLTPRPPIEGIMLIKVTTGITRKTLPSRIETPIDRKNMYTVMK